MYTGTCRCLKCGREYDSEEMFEGCPACKSEDFVSNITPFTSCQRRMEKRKPSESCFRGKTSGLSGDSAF